MALQKRNFDVVFTKGINTKLDDKLTIASDLLTLENRVFSKQGALTKRNGYTALTNDDATGSAITNLKSISTFKDRQLVMVANNNLYSYSDSNNVWVNKDNFISASASSEKIVRNSSEQTNLDAAIANGMTVFAWEDTRGGIRYSVQDEVSGSFLVSDVELVASGDTPRCIKAGNNVLIYYATGTNLEFKIIQSGNPVGTPSGGTARTDLDSGHVFDLTAIGNTVYCFYKRSTPGEAIVAYFNTNGTFQNQVALTETVDDHVAITSYMDTNNTDDYLQLAWKEDADNIKAKVLTRFLNTHVTTKTIDATVGLDIEKLTLARTSSTLDQVTIFYHVPLASNSNDYIRKNTLDLDGTVGTAAEFIRSLGICTDAFNDTEGNLYVGCLHESGLQATVFIVDANADVVCKFEPGNAGTHAALKFPCSVFTQNDGKMCFPISTKGRILSEGSAIFSRLGVAKACIDFDSLNTYNNVSINENLFVAGGILSNYDGQSITEQGFHLFPEGLATNSTPTTGGNMSNGTYQYVAVYEWTDNLGNVHRSAPSTPVTVVLSGGGAVQRVLMDVPTLRVTKKTGIRNDVTLELYRTQDTGSIFYKVTSITAPVDNDITADTVTITDTLADAAIISNEAVYTTGDVLENISAPSCDIVTAHKNRLWLAGLPERNKIRYSKEVVPGTALGFNEALSIDLEPTGGNIVNMASMDSNLIVFKENNIYTINGDGPTATGANSTLAEPQLIASDTGCKDSNSIVLGPDGLYFKSAKGIYLLTRSLQATYIGAPVEDFNDQVITSSQLLDDQNEIRFTTETGIVLVYNYYFKQWSTFTNKKIVDSVVWLNRYLYIDTDNNIFQETPGEYLDGGTFVSGKVSTGWIPLAGLQGFQRAYRAVVLGQMKSDHILRVKVYTDYHDTVQQEQLFTVGDILSSNSGFYGDGVYGTGTYGGTIPNLYQFEVHLARQKCQAVRIEIEDVFDNSELGSNTGEGMTLSGVTLQVGTKRGTNKFTKDKRG